MPEPLNSPARRGRLRRRAKAAWSPVLGYWSDHPWLDWAAAATLVTAEALLVGLAGHGDVLGSLELPRRITLYQTLATVGALVFGFATATIAFFYSSLGGKRTLLLTAVRFDEMIRTWKAVVGGPLVVVVSCVGFLMFDRTQTDHSGFRFFVQLAALLLVLRLVRLRWLFVQLIGLVTRDSQDDGDKPEKPPAGAALESPRSRTQSADR